MYVLKNHLNVFLYYTLNISFSSNYSNIFDNKNRNIKLIAFTKENKNKNKTEICKEIIKWNTML